jgi:transketolase
MGLEDLSIFRPIPGCVVLYPSDAYSTEACVQEMAKHKGMSYLRTTRPGTPLIYNRNEKFPIGGSKAVKKSSKDVVTVIGAGITLHEALKAYEALKKEGIYVRVIDAYSVSPIDGENISQAVTKTNGKVVVAEDHFEEGGLGDAVSSALKGHAEMVHLAVKDLPRSGQPDELLDRYGISAIHIQNAVKTLIKSQK